MGIEGCLSFSFFLFEAWLLVLYYELLCVASMILCMGLMVYFGGGPGQYFVFFILMDPRVLLSTPLGGILHLPFYYYLFNGKKIDTKGIKMEIGRAHV